MSTRLFHISFALAGFLTLGLDVFGAQPPDTLWTRSDFGDSVHASMIMEIEDGHFLMAGYVNKPHGEFSEIWLAKTDSLGKSEWTKSFGGNAGMSPNVIKRTSDGGYIIGGASSILNHWVASGGDSSYEGDAAITPNAFLLKTNAQGDSLWFRIYRDGSTCADVQQTTDGGYIFTGDTWLPSHVYLVRTDSNGDTLWTKIYEEPDTYQGTGVIQTRNGDFVISADLRIGPGFWTRLIRTDAQGNVLWTRTYDYCRCAPLLQIADGGFLVAGTLPGRTALGDRGYFHLVRTNSSGDTLWTRTLYESTGQMLSSIKPTGDRGYFLVGKGESEMEFGWSMAAAKVDAEGHHLWTKKLRGCRGGHSWRDGCQTRDGGFIILDTTQQGPYLVRLKAEDSTTPENH